MDLAVTVTVLVFVYFLAILEFKVHVSQTSKIIMGLV